MPNYKACTAPVPNPYPSTNLVTKPAPYPIKGKRKAACLDYEVSQASAQINTLREELILNEYDKAIAIRSIAREQRQIHVERYVLGLALTLPVALTLTLLTKDTNAGYRAKPSSPGCKTGAA